MEVRFRVRTKQDGPWITMDTNPAQQNKNGVQDRQRWLNREAMQTKCKHLTPTSAIVDIVTKWGNGQLGLRRPWAKCTAVRIRGIRRRFAGPKHSESAENTLNFDPLFRPCGELYESERG